jgi:hypothetical protein
MEEIEFDKVKSYLQFQWVILFNTSLKCLKNSFSNNIIFILF